VEVSLHWILSEAFLPMRRQRGIRLDRDDPQAKQGVLRRPALKLQLWNSGIAHFLRSFSNGTAGQPIDKPELRLIFAQLEVHLFSL